MPIVGCEYQVFSEKSFKSVSLWTSAPPDERQLWFFTIFSAKSRYSLISGSSVVP